MYSKVASPQALATAPANRWDLFPYCIVVLLLLTAIAIFHVWSRCKVIDMNLQIAETRRQVKELQQEQTRMKVEAASLKTPARIEMLARGELGMALPNDQQVVLVK
jgi:cell division protein FtsL